MDGCGVYSELCPCGRGEYHSVGTKANGHDARRGIGIPGIILSQMEGVRPLAI